jgi:hypothetical protein
MLITAHLDLCYSTLMCNWWDMKQQMKDNDESEQQIQQNQSLSWHMSGRNQKSSYHVSETRILQPRSSNCNKTLYGSQRVTPWIKN